MSAPDRRAMVERPGVDLSVRRQCAAVEPGAFGGLPAEAGHRRGQSEREDFVEAFRLVVEGSGCRQS